MPTQKRGTGGRHNFQSLAYRQYTVGKEDREDQKPEPSLEGGQFIEIKKMQKTLWAERARVGEEK